MNKLNTVEVPFFTKLNSKLISNKAMNPLRTNKTQKKRHPLWMSLIH